MITVNGVVHRTMDDAAPLFGVSKKTVYIWIQKKIIPSPPKVKQGLKKVQVFPEEYMKDALRSLRESSQ